MREECTTGWAAGRARADVVAVEADVDLAERHRLAEQLLDQVPQPPRDQGAAGVDADERDLLVAVSLHDLVGDPHQRTSEILAVEDCVAQASVPLPGLAGPG